MKARWILALGFAGTILACSGGGSKSSSAGGTAAGGGEVAAATDDHAAGEKIFRTYCIVCHGVDGKLGLNGAKDLSVSELGLDEKIEQVTKGKGLMTPFEGILSAEQIRQVSEYTLTFLQ